MHSKLQESSLRMETNRACGCKKNVSGHGMGRVEVAYASGEGHGQDRMWARRPLDQSACATRFCGRQIQGSSSLIRLAGCRQSGERVCEPSLRIDAVELGGLDQRYTESLKT
jgi:hypothetical protein